MCLMTLKSGPLHHVLAGFGAAVAPHQGSFPCPITLSSLSLAHTPGQEPPPTAGTRTALHRIPPASPAHPRDIHSQKRMLRGHRHQCRTQTDRQQGSPATFDKVEVRVHFICSIDGNIEL